MLRLGDGRAPDPPAAIIDSRTLRFTPESGTRAGYDEAKRKRGSKVHMAVDTLGHLLALHVTPADFGDRAAVGRLCADIQDATGEEVQLAYVDQGYTAEAVAQAAGPRALRWRSSSWPKPSAASSCCPGAGWSNDPLPGRPDAAGSSKITSDTPQHSQAFTSSPLSDTYSNTPLS